MARFSKRACLLLAIILMVSALSPVAFAAQAENGDWQVYELNYSGKYPQSLQTLGNRIAITGLPEDPDCSFIWLMVLDGCGTKRHDEIKARSDDSSVQFAIPNSVSGTYELGVYYSSERYATYHELLSIEQVEFRSGTVMVPTSPALDLNLSFTSQYVPSENALEYYLRPSKGIQSDEEEIIRTAAQITSGISDTYAKALAIHDWVCDSIYYDFDVYYGRVQKDDSSALNTLKTGRSVCEGYANLTVALLRASGIPARKVSGYALGMSGGNTFPSDVLAGTGDSNHAWNEAFVDGRWVIMDTTWDSDNDYEYGNITSSGGCYRHRYFDISQWLLAQDHATVRAIVYKEMYLYIGYPEYYTDEGWKPLTSDGAVPLVVDGRTLIPIRPVIEEMGGTVEWTPATEYYLPRIVCKTYGYHAQMWLTWNQLYVNGEELSFDVPPQVINGRTMIPLRVLLEAMGCVVKWDDRADGWNGRITIGSVA